MMPLTEDSIICYKYYPILHISVPENIFQCLPDFLLLSGPPTFSSQNLDAIEEFVIIESSSVLFMKRQFCSSVFKEEISFIHL